MRWKRLGLLALIGAVLGIAGLASSGGAQTPPPPTFTIPSFTIPDIPPPTQGPPTTSSPPTMSPTSSSTSSPPPTMAPPTIPGDVQERLDEELEGIIDRLEEFGDQFADIVDELRAIQEEF